jgi:hypothetical protein
VPAGSVGSSWSDKAYSGFGKRVNKPSFSIAAAPENDFLRRLPDQHQRSVPTLAVMRHQFGGADPRRHMQILSAGVGHGDSLARSVLGSDCAGKREPGLFLNRQSIEFSTQHSRWPRPILQERNDARATNRIARFVLELAFEHGMACFTPTPIREISSSKKTAHFL